MSFRGRDPHPDELISASLHGDLTPEERQRLDAHLAACAECRETLAVFRAQRSEIGRLRAVDPPRDLAARVRAGIESGRFAPAPWWRRTGVLLGIGGSLATVAAGILAVVVLSNLRPTQPVAFQSATPTTAAESLGPKPSSPSPAATLSQAPSPTPAIELAPGQLAAIVAEGGTPSQPRNWEFRDLNNQHSITVEAASGVPISAALSPSGTQLAYITSLGQSGAQEVRVLDLTDGRTIHLGCSDSWPFTDRLVWSPDGSQLAYTRAGVDLGAAQQDCANAPPQDQGKVDVWIFNAETEKATRRTVSGDAYAADYRPSTQDNGAPRLLVSHAAAVPWTEELVPVGSQAGADGQSVENVFMPRLAPDGTRAMFWRGTMDGGPSGWSFVSGGMPYLSAPGSAEWSISPDGTPLFTDLSLHSASDGFNDGNLTWSPDGRYVAFWGFFWAGTKQGPQGDYPDETAAYVGPSDTGLSIDSRLNPGEADTYVEDVKFGANGEAVLVMVATPGGDISPPPSAVIYEVPLSGGKATVINGVDGNPIPWIGPVVVGTDASAPSSSPQATPGH